MLLFVRAFHLSVGKPSVMFYLENGSRSKVKVIAFFLTVSIF
jgi:hypothetical protein